MCNKGFTKTVLAKQKHAEFMLKLAEKIYSLALTGLLGSPVLYWFAHKETQGNGEFGAFMTLTICGLLGAFYLQHKAITLFNDPADSATTPLNKGEK